MTTDIITQYATKWYIVLPILIIGYNLYSYANRRYLLRKLGAKEYANIEHDGWCGFRLPFIILEKKKEGLLSEYGSERYKFITNPHIHTFTFLIFNLPLVNTIDPENIKAILATQFNDFALGKRHKYFYPLLGDGIFTLDGEGWKHSRAMLRPQFSRDQVAHVQALEPHVQILAQHIRKNKGQLFDLQELFFRFTVDSATEFLFGESVGSLKDASIGYPTPDIDFDGRTGFANAFNVSQNYLASRSVLQDLYFLINDRKFRDSTKAVHKFADYYVQKALNTSQDELDKRSLGGYIFLYELVKETRDPRVLRDQLLNILVAGRDTTAGLLSFAFYEMSRNAQIWNKLKEEIYERFGSGDESDLESITFEALKKCEYLKAVLNETLRLYPSVPQNFRVATKDTTLPRGGGPDGLDPVLVQKGQSVMYSVYSLHRLEEYYGKDADLFRPERWFEPETRKLGWAYLPFNGGPRICLGQQFALTEASYVVARLVQLFPNLHASPSDTEYPPKISAQLTACLQYENLVSMS
ncbi:cytochrome P450 alkane hydroxylase [Scheffersomyces amazonensis]|uniref:cytochrome P450 alkane hydroxylase n=1 Tax=Scheffersomyces amazonensis TaxID=1078765 RepID=UPI00315C5CB4